jgi:hypothetical protein
MWAIITFILTCKGVLRVLVFQNRLKEAIDLSLKIDDGNYFYQLLKRMNCDYNLNI